MRVKGPFPGILAPPRIPPIHVWPCSPASQGQTHVKGARPVGEGEHYPVQSGTPPGAFTPGSPLTYSPQMPMEPLTSRADSSRIGLPQTEFAGWGAQPKVVPTVIACARRGSRSAGRGRDVLCAARALAAGMHVHVSGEGNESPPAETRVRGREGGGPTSPRLHRRRANPTPACVGAGTHGGHDVGLEGSWDGWSTRHVMQRTGKDFTLVKLLSPGIYQVCGGCDDERPPPCLPGRLPSSQYTRARTRTRSPRRSTSSSWTGSGGTTPT